MKKILLLYHSFTVPKPSEDFSRPFSTFSPIPQDYGILFRDLPGRFSFYSPLDTQEIGSLSFSLAHTERGGNWLESWLANISKAGRSEA